MLMKNWYCLMTSNLCLTLYHSIKDPATRVSTRVYINWNTSINETSNEEG